MLTNFCNNVKHKLIPVAAQSMAWVCGCLLAGILGSNLAGGHGCLYLVRVVCCQVEVSVTS